MTAHPGEASSDRFVEVDGVLLRVRTLGEGRPLLLIMGVGGNVEMWHPFDRELNDRGIHTISFDAPGTGESGELDRPRRMPWLARMVEHLLDHLGYERVDVLGISWGGGLAQQLAHQAPERMRRLGARGHGPGGARTRRCAGQPQCLDQHAQSPALPRS